jgi:hypothetical protein
MKKETFSVRVFSLCGDHAMTVFMHSTETTGAQQAALDFVSKKLGRSSSDYFAHASRLFKTAHKKAQPLELDYETC